jgi:16S rRNA (cytosine1402-N4)-methyltransferase
VQLDAHIPVMPNQVLDGLAVRPGLRYCDATLGLGGHTEQILQRSAPDGEVVAIDRDPAALERSKRRLAPFGGRVRFCQGNFADVVSILEDLGLVPVDGLLLDLGVSSLQLDQAERGFSFSADGPLDMRMDPTQGQSASELIAQLSEAELARVIRDYGEQPASRAIARAIKRAHTSGELQGTSDLARVVASVVRSRARRGRRGRRSKIHPATRTFMALRMAVNDELGSLHRLLDTFTEAIRPGGRVAVITFHSLEDRAVKRRFVNLADPCTCPPSLPVCCCNKQPQLSLVTRRPLRPEEAEVEANPRARSSKLRVAERI